MGRGSRSTTTTWRFRRCCCTTFRRGILGLGLTALLASFMSGMAGNVTAFNTVWTYDIYQSYINKRGTDAHYLWMGRMATIGGIVLSIGAAYAATSFNNIMDALQLIFSLVNAPSVCYVSAGDVLEEDYRAWGVCRVAGGDGGGSGASWVDAAGGGCSRAAWGVAAPGACLSERYGAELLDGYLCVFGEYGRDDCGEPGDRGRGRSRSWWGWCIR